MRGRIWGEDEEEVGGERECGEREEATVERGEEGGFSHFNRILLILAT